MQPALARHVSEENLERYCLNSLAEPELARAEEHLLVCHACQDRLEETEQYIRAVQAAACEARRRQARGWFTWRAFTRPVWTLAAVAATVLLAVGLQQPHGVPAPAAVALEATRGPAAPFAKAPAGHPLALHLDVAGLPGLPSYRAEVVTGTGRRVWAGPAGLQAGRAAVNLPSALPRGRYYVRLYSPSFELLREFGLVIE